MSWRIDLCRLLVTLLLVTALFGCKSDEAIFQNSNIWGPSPIKRPQDASQIAAHAIESVFVSAEDTSDPRRWNDLEASSGWRLPLSEAVSIGLNNSAIVRTLPAGRPQIATDSSRVDRTTIFEPMIEETEIEAELGRFDARLEAILLAHPEEYPPNTAPNGTSNRPPKLDRGAFEVGVRKPTVTGGDIAMLLDSDYRYIPPRFNSQTVNPQYQPEFGLELSQPLLRGAGRRINLNPVTIVAAQAQESAWELQAEVLGMVRSVEAVYWSLYQERGAVQTIDRLLPLLDEAVRLAEANARADLAIPADVAQAQTVLFSFQQRRVQAQTNVRQQESLLRDLIGLSADVERYIIPDDPAVPESPRIDWQNTVDTALRQRPEIIRQRLSVYAARLALEIAENRRLPTVDAIAAYRVKGLGDDLGKALDLLGDVEFNDWAVGFLFDYPLGNRQARAQARAARLVVDREQAKLQEAVHAATHELSQLVYQLDAVYREYRIALKRRDANDLWLRGARARYRNPTGEATLARSLDLYLRAIRSAAESEQELIILQASYRKVLARFLEAKGTLLQSRQIHLEADPRAKIEAMEFDLERLPRLPGNLAGEMEDDLDSVGQQDPMDRELLPE